MSGQHAVKQAVLPFTTYICAYVMLDVRNRSSESAAVGKERTLHQLRQLQQWLAMT
jgi:hypothetical protein